MSLTASIAKKIFFVFLVSMLVPGLPPKTTFPFVGFKIKPPKDLKGGMHSNSLLNDAEHLLVGVVNGPETVIMRDNAIYMGVKGGAVVSYNQSGNRLDYIVKFGENCLDVYAEATCGRPLGIAFDTQGNNLIVADAYYGLWLYDLDEKKKHLLVSPQTPLPGADNTKRPAKIFNGVAVDKNGLIYWTDSSSDFSLEDTMFASFSNPSGRLFLFDRKKNTNKLIRDQLFYPNGLVLSPDEDYLIVAETGGLRLFKYHIKGYNKGETEVFVDGLPGHPAKITKDSDGIWIPLVLSVDEKYQSTYIMFSQSPQVRFFFARFFSLMELFCCSINSVFPNEFAQRCIHYIGHSETFKFKAPQRTTVVRVNWKGEIEGSLHGYDNSVGIISHILENEDELIFGSPSNQFLARVKFPKDGKIIEKGVRQ